jgi:hypothetical protein
MDSSWIAKHMIHLQRTAFDNLYHSLVMLQEHAEKMTGTFFEQATWIPEESSRIVAQWIELLKNGRNEFKAAVDDSFSKVDELLSAEKQARSEI